MALSDKINLKPVGEVHNDFVDEIPEDYKETVSELEIYEEYKDALLGIEEHSHITIIFWFDESDRSRKQVHPMADKDNPLTGVFATRSPVRPNPLAVTVCELIKREGNILHAKGVDALNGTPIIDIKSYKYNIDDPEYPDWVPE